MTRRCSRAVLLVGIAFAFTAIAGSASAEVGKKVAVATGNSGVIVTFPAMTDVLTVAVPATYKSKANFLIVTASYLSSCTGGDYMGSIVEVAGNPLAPYIPVETYDEDAAGQVVSRVYYLLPENLGGPAVPPASTVTLKMTSISGSGCTARNATMTVEAAK
jgi:hypothetical protein